jgi:NAD(P)-dependent dehydrogenase (short-subunit alcohol dehydrogenase family)
VSGWNGTRRHDLGAQNPKFLKFVLGKIPCGKLAKVEHVAAAVFLASDEAAMVNCHTLCVDGGWTAW